MLPSKQVLTQAVLASRRGPLPPGGLTCHASKHRQVRSCTKWRHRRIADVASTARQGLALLSQMCPGLHHRASVYASSARRFCVRQQRKAVKATDLRPAAPCSPLPAVPTCRPPARRALPCTSSCWVVMLRVKDSWSAAWHGTEWQAE